MIKFFKKLFKKPVVEAWKQITPPKIVTATYFKEHLTVNYEDGSVREYEGSCTVWKHYPMMQRCGTFKEGELLDIWSYIKKHGNPYPTAHIKNKMKETNDKFGL